jgi:hypothetical protein
LFLAQDDGEKVLAAVVGDLHAAVLENHDRVSVSTARREVVDAGGGERLIPGVALVVAVVFCLFSIDVIFWSFGENKLKR